MERSTELANLEKDNARRIDLLQRQGIELHPGTFELLQITVYLEYLITNGGDTPEALLPAKMEFAERAGVAIDQLDRAYKRKRNSSNHQ